MISIVSSEKSAVSDSDYVCVNCDDSV